MISLVICCYTAYLNTPKSPFLFNPVAQWRMYGVNGWFAGLVLEMRAGTEYSVQCPTELPANHRQHASQAAAKALALVENRVACRCTGYFYTET